MGRDIYYSNYMVKQLCNMGKCIFQWNYCV